MNFRRRLRQRLCSLTNTTPSTDFRQLIFALQSSPCFRGGVNEFEHISWRSSPIGLPSSAWFDDAPWRIRSRSGLTCADGPSARREVEESEQRFPVLAQTGDRLVRRSVNLAKIDFHVDLDREGDLVQHVGGLVNPTPLVSGALQEISRKKPVLKNRVPQEIEDAIVALALEQPAFGLVRIADELRKRWLMVSSAGVRCVWQRHDLETINRRLNAAHRGLWNPDLRAGDDSPSAALYSSMPATALLMPLHVRHVGKALPHPLHFPSRG